MSKFKKSAVAALVASLVMGSAGVANAAAYTQDQYDALVKALTDVKTHADNAGSTYNGSITHDKDAAALDAALINHEENGLNIASGYGNGHRVDLSDIPAYLKSIGINAPASQTITQPGSTSGGIAPTGKSSTVNPPAPGTVDQDAIDTAQTTAINDHAAAINTLNSSLTATNETATKAYDNTHTLAGIVQTDEQQIATNTGKLTTLGGTVADHEQKITANKAAADAAQATADQNTSDIATNTAGVAGATKAIGDVAHEVQRQSDLNAAFDRMDAVRHEQERQEDHATIQHLKERLAQITDKASTDGKAVQQQIDTLTTQQAGLSKAPTVTASNATITALNPVTAITSPVKPTTTTLAGMKSAVAPKASPLASIPAADLSQINQWKSVYQNLSIFSSSNIDQLIADAYKNGGLQGIDKWASQQQTTDTNTGNHVFIPQITSGQPVAKATAPQTTVQPQANVAAAGQGDVFDKAAQTAIDQKQSQDITATQGAVKSEALTRMQAITQLDQQKADKTALDTEKQERQTADQQHTSDIQTNKQAISQNVTRIGDNSNLIAANKTEIQRVDANQQQTDKRSLANGLAIQTVTSAQKTDAANISTLQTDEAKDRTDIKQNHVDAVTALTVSKATETKVNTFDSRITSNTAKADHAEKSADYAVNTSNQVKQDVQSYFVQQDQFNTAAVNEMKAESARREAGDAKTLAQANAYTDQKLSQQTKYNERTRKLAAAGAAGAMAMANIPQVEQDAQFAIGAAGANYANENSLAVGASFHAGKSTIVKISSSADTANNFGVAAGVSVNFGQ